ncbi:MAG: polymer-forming cytoskeletal protein [Phenylobacterium sp.]|uniref:polymer-forming cytoskeletal protein n=1 Tax=Phenylobacterium sp. TaxID=1871053 RepID=UPI002736DE95|nr:polymer-forming cytoskeletal protein [Phenylobacterium sp.]MDP3174984.1 polymer-forming cytoskeletal protein [Phenylobacterium sp.]
MFTKTTAKTPDQAVAPMKLEPGPPTDTSAASPTARKPKVATLIAEHMTVEGGVVGEGELHIDGVVRGDLRVGRLTIGDTGHVEGSIVAESVEIRGRVVGTVTAKSVRLHGSAYVDGDVTHEQLAMEIGAFFQGRSLKFQRPAGSTTTAQPAVQSPAPSPSPSIAPTTSSATPPPGAPKDAPPSGAAKPLN